MTNKEINKAIANIVGDPQEYDLRRELRIVECGWHLGQMDARLASIPEDERHLYTFTSSAAAPYCEDLNLALYAAKRIADKNQYTFVLSYESHDWKAAFGDYRDCAEYTGGSQAYATCVAILKFMGKL